MTDHITTPDWELVDYFATQIALVQGADRHAREEARARILRDYLLFVENCLWITTRKRETRLLRYFPPQMKFLAAVDECRKADEPVLIVVLKARQEGISTATASILFLDTIITPNTASKVLAHERSSASWIFQMYERFNDYLFHGVHEDKRERYAPFRLKEGVGGRSGAMLVFGEDSGDRSKGLASSIEVLVPREAGGDTSGRTASGMTAQNLHLSEVAKWQNADATLSSLMQTFPDEPGMATIVESTAERAGDAFHELCDAARGGDIPYKFVFLPWTDMPTYARGFDSPKERDEFCKSLNASASDTYGNEAELVESYGLSLEQLNWRRRTWKVKCRRSWQHFMREYPLTPEQAFQSTGGNYIDPQRVSIYLAKSKPSVKSGYLQPSEAGNIPYHEASTSLPFVHVWEPPVPYVEYIIAADIALDETARDFSAGVVLRRMPLKVCTRIRGTDDVRTNESEFAAQLAHAGYWYNTALLAPERNFLGHSIIEKLQVDHRYPNVLNELDITPDAVTRTGRWGFNTSASNRRQMLSALKELIEDGEIEIWDEILIREIGALTAGKSGKRIEAPKKGRPRGKGTPESGYYDDLVMALAIAYWVHLHLPPPKAPQIKQAEAEYRYRNQSRLPNPWENPSEYRIDYV